MSEPTPPWVAYPGHGPDAFFWREAGEPWFSLVWRPFWDGLDQPGRGRFLAAHPAPADWAAHLAEDLDAHFAAIDAEDVASGVLDAQGRRRDRPEPRRGWLARWLGR